MSRTPPPITKTDVPADDATLSRRSFLSGLAALGTTALVGCGTQATKDSSVASPKTLPEGGTDLKPEEDVKMATPTTTVIVPTNQKAVVITVTIDNGKVVDVQAINGGTINNNPSGADVSNDHGSGNGFQHVASIFLKHSSPGCLYWFGGSWRQGC